ncbi:hypothetical protein CEXT_536941 [Caerostris extrusa]|uniref:Uncharacterized protein n=1 Tax=Caerostris extrusa TaxID=172846 RepID=A0AAV4P2D0_CAEEX|nr:hypothetical protein CEXT_536941 [Caerostris extrusa]
MEERTPLLWQPWLLPSSWKLKMAAGISDVMRGHFAFRVFVYAGLRINNFQSPTSFLEFFQQFKFVVVQFSCIENKKHFGRTPDVAFG